MIFDDSVRYTTVVSLSLRVSRTILVVPLQSDARFVISVNFDKSLLPLFQISETETD